MASRRLREAAEDGSDPELVNALAREVADQRRKAAAAFLPVLTRIIRKASPEDRAALTRSMGPDFPMRYAKKLSNPIYAPALFEIFAQIADASEPRPLVG